MSRRNDDSRERTGISVVVPPLNQGRFIDEAIQSVLAQGYPNVEILVVDGGSSDDALERLRAYGSDICWCGI